MRKLKITTVFATATAALLLGVSAAHAAYGITGFDVQTQTGQDGGYYAQAGGHPYSIKTSIEWNSHPDPNAFDLPRPDGSIKDALVDLPPGILGNVSGLPTCSSALLSSQTTELNGSRPMCPIDSQIGTVALAIEATPLFSEGGADGRLSLYNMEPPTGLPARFGFNIAGTIIFLDANLINSDGEYKLTIGPHNTPQALRVYRSIITFWGAPSDHGHDEERCAFLGNLPPFCPGTGPFNGPHASNTGTAFVTNSTSCSPLGEGKPWTLRTNSWEDPANFITRTIFSHNDPGFPVAPEEWGSPRGVENCDIVPFTPTLSAKPTTKQAESPSGLNVEVTVPTDGFDNPTGIAQAHLKKAVVRLPEGVTINPSSGAGLGTCTRAQFEAETATSEFGDGCPAESKIGSATIKSPAIDEPLSGSLFIAKPDDPGTAIAGTENPFDSLLAMYMVLKNPDRGLLVKLAGKVETDPRTGQITSTFEDLPQLPFTTFKLGFREGPRSPLVTPQACGSYETEAEFTPWSDPNKVVTVKAPLQITGGPNNGPCPSGGLPPFKPGLIAGSINNAAGHYSPFNVRLFRTDAEQEITHFSIKLPPGISGKLAGVPFCSDAAIAAAGAATRTGAQELASPSCPAASEVGHTLVGAGVGSVLTYAPGKVYLGGPYNGSALSIAAITAAKVGPFDLGTVVVRQALKVDPETAEVFVDATGSDPIPHIIDGITTHIRDIRAYVDKPEFTLNPTNCSRTSTASTLLGSGLDFASAIDDRPVTVSTPYQAADCAALGFKPALKLQLKGGTKRAGHPSLRATLKMKPGMANIARAQVTLPKSEFLDQSHIGTVCTRVQYAKDQCPAASVYGYARGFTPILDEPLEGPVYLRSSEHKLPDLVAGLKSGKIEIDLAGRIDSVNGQIRSTFESVPDAPVSSFTLTMQGGKKGLLENSTNLCAKAHKAIVEFDGQNGKISDSNPVVKPQCSKAKRKAAKRRNAR